MSQEVPRRDLRFAAFIKTDEFGDWLTEEGNVTRLLDVVWKVAEKECVAWRSENCEPELLKKLNRKNRVKINASMVSLIQHFRIGKNDLDNFLRPLMQDLGSVWQVSFFERSSYTILRDITDNRAKLAREAGLHWQGIKIKDSPEIILLLWCTLSVFLPWLMGDQNWYRFLNNGRKHLVVACFVDLYKKFRFTTNTSAGQVQVLLKFMVPGAENSPFSVVPIARYTGPETYECLAAILRERVLQPLADLEKTGFMFKDERWTISFVHIPDGACMSKLFQIGSTRGEYPIGIVPVHDSQVSDTVLNPSSPCERFAQQTLLSAQWETKSIPTVKSYTETSRAELSKLYKGLTLRENLVGSDVCRHIPGPCHLDACVRNRTQVCFYYTALGLPLPTSASKLCTHFWRFCC